MEIEILDAIAKNLAAKGYKLNYSQICDQIKNISHLDAKFNQTQHSVNNLWNMYSLDPPKPPYKYYFETQNEAISFAKRAKKKHNVNCDIDLVDYRKWKLTTTK